MPAPHSALFFLAASSLFLSPAIAQQSSNSSQCRNDQSWGPTEPPTTPQPPTLSPASTLPAPVPLLPQIGPTAPPSLSARKAATSKPSGSILPKVRTSSPRICPTSDASLRSSDYRIISYREDKTTREIAQKPSTSNALRTFSQTQRRMLRECRARIKMPAMYVPS